MLQTVEDDGLGNVLTQEVGKILPHSFESIVGGTETAVHGVDFFSSDPAMWLFDWSISSTERLVYGSVSTDDQLLMMEGIWLTINQVWDDHGVQRRDTITLFLPLSVEAEGGNRVLVMASDYFVEVPCDELDLSPQECADLQQCFTDYATCMAQADTQYAADFAACGTLRRTLSVGVGGGVAGAGVGALCGGPLPAAFGCVIGFVAAPLADYRMCTANALDTRTTNRLLCADALENCIEGWIVSP